MRAYWLPLWYNRPRTGKLSLKGQRENIQSLLWLLLKARKERLNSFLPLPARLEKTWVLCPEIAQQAVSHVSGNLEVQRQLLESNPVAQCTCQIATDSCRLFGSLQLISRTLSMLLPLVPHIWASGLCPHSGTAADFSTSSINFSNIHATSGLHLEP